MDDLDYFDYSSLFSFETDQIDSQNSDRIRSVADQLELDIDQSNLHSTPPPGIDELPDLNVEAPELLNEETYDISSESDGEDIEIELLNFTGDLKGNLKGVRAKKLEELHQLYKNHSNALGFGVRKGSEHKSVKTKKVLGKYFYCRCQGHQSRRRDKTNSTPLPVQPGEVVLPSPIPDNHEENIKKRKRKNRHGIRRTGCEAKIRVKYLRKEDVYEIATHHLEHNHDLTSLYWNHYKRSERHISEETGELIGQLVGAGIKPRDGFNMLSKSAGGEENVGHTRRDYSNYVQRLKAQQIEDGDAQTLSNILRDTKNDDPAFFYDWKLGDGCRLRHLVCVDSMMIQDFILYGDTVIFDTTYNTNRYGMACGMFVGINNHWNTVMFGLAFMSDETEDTFVWVLKKFVEAMGGREPKTIFTDQDTAMANAIKRVFKDRVKHRLCIWHIQQNAISHFGKLNTDKDFKESFDHCLMGCANEVEFDMCWSALMDKYNLWEESWFRKLYGIKDKWCTALSNDFFSAGILSTQRSESTNHSIKFDADRTTSLTEFWGIYNKTVQRWRSLEQMKEFESTNTLPRPDLFGGLIRNAADVYTLEVFRFFEHEAKAAFAARYKVCQYQENHIVMEVSHENYPDRFERVDFKKIEEDVIVECTCKHFSVVGWLCFHCIKALNFGNIDYIPPQYVVKRWTKDVKKAVWDTAYQGRITSNTEPLESLPWKQFMSRKFYDLITTCQEDNAAKRILEDSFNMTTIKVQNHLSSQNKVAPTTSLGSEASTNVIDPVLNAPDVIESVVGEVPASKRQRKKNKKTASEIPNDELVNDPVLAKTKGRPKNPKKIESKFTRKKPLKDSDFDNSTRNPHLI